VYFPLRLFAVLVTELASAFGGDLEFDAELAFEVEFSVRLASQID